MRLSQILKSQSIHPGGDEDGGGSWGIFMSPEEPEYVVKLFYDEQQFIEQKTGYDKALRDPDLLEFANSYRVIIIHLDTATYPLNRKASPFKKALLLPFLANPPWEKIGKFGNLETRNKIAECGVDVERIKNDFHRNGLASWEATFFVHSNSRDIKVIDFTYSEVISKNYVKGFPDE